MHENPFLKGNYAPVRMEGTGFPLRVLGKPALRGTLFRNGTNPQFQPREPYHWFGGDGMIHGISFDGQQAWSMNRWVRTQRFTLERQLGFNALANFGCPQNIAPECLAALAALPPENQSAAAFGLCIDVANTHVLPWGEPRDSNGSRELLALAEGGLPYRMDASSLATREARNVSGFQTFTAHPKALGGYAGSKANHLIGHATKATGELGIVALDRAGGSELLGMIPTPAPAMLHDIAITETSVVLPWFPAVYEIPGQGNSNEGMGGISWKPELGVRVAIAPLRPGFGGKDVRWFDAPTCHSYHIVNAFDDDNCVVLDLICKPRLALFGDDQDIGQAYLARWRMNLASGNLSEEILLRADIEFPRIDERSIGKSHTHCFLAAASKASKTFNTVIRLDVGTGKTMEYTFAGEISEPIHGVDQSGNESVVVTEYLPSRGISQVVFLNPADLQVQGLIELEMRVPHGFHGCFVPDTLLDKPCL